MTAPNQPIRTRVAPSPTGDPHIGTVYMALFNYVFAKKHGGQFLLRIEDTDQTRSTAESEQAIYDALRWAGLSWDEGPDAGGPHGPYRQSERTDIYREHCDRLLDSGHAYYCFATAEQLNEYRAQRQTDGLPTGYDGSLGMVARDEALPRIEAGETAVIRLKVPTEGDCVFADMLRGEIRIPWSQVDHQILLKSDGFPTYHLANVVDDHLMLISHVIRGEEWINSAPKHLLLYEAFGWTAPQLAHLPLLRNPDKSKLSKRKNPTGVFYYRQSGILPEALLNYLGLMAYSMADEREIFSLDEMIAEFDLKRVSLGGPIFDVKKLEWVNGCYLREKRTPEQLLGELKGWLLNDAMLGKIVPLAQKRIDKLADFVPLVGFLFADRLEYSVEALIGKKLDGPRLAELLQIVTWELEQVRPWETEPIKAVFERVAEKEELKMRDFMPSFFVAVTGSPSSLPLFDSMEIIGRDMTRRRLQYAQEKLDEAGHSLSKKGLKKLEKHYADQYGTGN